ncbi:MAG: methionyl-tRNA formyltransferase [Clostridia bacterium]|nr:methionyl-tRNA formyltransferase [Clostridia bacterium]
MNIVFMGTPDFAVEALAKIFESGHNVQAVVSQPDKPSGRGMKLLPTPVKEYALSKNLKVYQPAKIKNNEEFISEIKALKPDVIVVVAYGKLLPQEILDIPKYGCINVHGSLLPKYRGSAPIQWAIINGEEKTGITTMYMSEGMDTGDMILKQEVMIENDDTYGTLYEKLKKVGGKLILETLEKIADGLIPREKQSDDFSIAPMIEKSLGNINWNKSAIEIRNLIRGLNPMPGAYTNLDSQKMKIWAADLVPDIIENDMLPGTVIKADSKEGLFVSTGDGVLRITELQMPNAKKMLATDYLRGNIVEIGSILYQ